VIGWSLSAVFQNTIVQADEYRKLSFYQLWQTMPTAMGDYEVELLCTDADTPGPWCADTNGALIICWFRSIYVDRDSGISRISRRWNEASLHTQC
jgi:hypothetical protein